MNRLIDLLLIGVLVIGVFLVRRLDLLAVAAAAVIIVTALAIATNAVIQGPPWLNSFFTLCGLRDESTSSTVLEVKNPNPAQGEAQVAR